MNNRDMQEDMNRGHLVSNSNQTTRLGHREARGRQPPIILQQAARGQREATSEQRPVMSTSIKRSNFAPVPAATNMAPTSVNSTIDLQNQTADRQFYHASTHHQQMKMAGGRPLSNEYQQMGELPNDSLNNHDGYMMQEQQQQVPASSNTLHVMSAQAVKRATAANSNQQIRASIFSTGQQLGSNMGTSLGHYNATGQDPNFLGQTHSQQQLNMMPMAGNVRAKSKGAHPSSQVQFRDRGGAHQMQPGSAMGNFSTRTNNNSLLNATEQMQFGLGTSGPLHQRMNNQSSVNSGIVTLQQQQQQSSFLQHNQSANAASSRGNGLRVQSQVNNHTAVNQSKSGQKGGRPGHQSHTSSFRSIGSANLKGRNAQKLFQYPRAAAAQGGVDSMDMKPATSVPTTDTLNKMQVMDIEHTEGSSAIDSLNTNQAQIRAVQEIENTSSYGIIATVRQLMLIQNRNRFSGNVPDAAPVSFFVGSPNDMANLILRPGGQEMNDVIIRSTELNQPGQRTIEADSLRTRIGEIKRLYEISNMYNNSQSNMSSAFHNSRRNRNQLVTDPTQMQSSSTFDNEGMSAGTPLPSTEDIASDIEKVLTYLARESGTTYRQGYNEILGPFLWLAIRDSLGLVETYANEAASLRGFQRDPWSAMGQVSLNNEEDQLSQENFQELLRNPLTLAAHATSLFIDIFVPTLFESDEDFNCIQSCFCLLRLLMKYHDPEVYSILGQADVPPELYAPRWFYTVFASKCERIEPLLHLWQALLKEPDHQGYKASGVHWHKKRPLFTLTLSLMWLNRGHILECDRSDLLELMAGMSIGQDQRQIEELLACADHFYQETPISLWESREMNALFGENANASYKIMTKREKERMHLRLDQYQCLPVEVAEFLKNIYGDSELGAYPAGDITPGHARDELQIQLQCANPKCFEFTQAVQAISYNRRLGRLQTLQHFAPIYQRVLTRVIRNIIEGGASRVKLDQGDLATLLKRLALGPKLVGKLAQHPQAQRGLERRELPEEGLNENSRIKNGSTYLELCAGCRAMLKRQSRGSVIDGQHMLNIIPVDCRAQLLQNEALLMRCTQLQVTAQCEKRGLDKMVANLQEGLKDMRHLCLLSLKSEEVPNSYQEAHQKKLQRSFVSTAGNSETGYCIEEFQSRVLSIVQESFRRQGFKYVGVLPGGFELCHNFIAEQNKRIIEQFVLREVDAVMVGGSGALKDVDVTVGRRTPALIELVDAHWADDCFHCYQANESIHHDDEQPFAVAHDGAAGYRNVHEHMELEGRDMRNPQSMQGSANVETTRGWDSSSTIQQPGFNQLQTSSSIKIRLQKKKYDAKTYNISHGRQSGGDFEFVDVPSAERETAGAFDFFQGIRGWWKDNVASQPIFGMGNGQDDDEEIGMITGASHDEDLMMRGGSKHYEDEVEVVHLLKNVTQQTRRQMQLQKDKNRTASNAAEPRLPTMGNASVGGPQNTQQRNRPSNASDTKVLGTHFGRETTGLSHGATANFSSGGDHNQRTMLAAVVNATGPQSRSKPGGKDISPTQSARKKKPSTGGLNQQYTSPTSVLNRGSPHGVGVASASKRTGGIQGSTAAAQVAVSRQMSPSPRSTSGYGVVKRINGNSKFGVSGNKNLANADRNRTTIKQEERSRAHSESMELQGHLRSNATATNAVAGAPAAERSAKRTDLSLQRNIKKGSVRQGSILQETTLDAATALASSNRAQEQTSSRQQHQQKTTDVSTERPTDRNRSQEGQNREAADTKAVEVKKEKTTPGTGEFLLEERSYYLCNGIQKQQVYSPHSIGLVEKIVLHDQPANSNDIVIYHVKRLASSHLQQLIQHQQQQSGSAQPQDQPRIFGHDSKSASVTSIIITQFTTICLCQALQTVQSRFFMHDLIKITSRKSSAKIITFYFRIPQFGEYNTNFYKALEQEKTNDRHESENTILATYNENPVVSYQFAYKRKKFQEVKMGFEFKSEEQARNCIERVSVLYKRLKNLYREEGGLGHHGTQRAHGKSDVTPGGGGSTPTGANQGK